MNDAHVEAEIKILEGFITKIGEKKHNEYTVTFKQLFDDDEVANTLESLAGTLKAGKRRKIWSYKAELLLQGMSDNEVITYVVADM